MTNIIFTLDNSRVIPICDDDGRELEAGQYRGQIESPAFESHWIPLWKYENGACVRRTTEEIAADIAEIPVPPSTPEQIDRADIDYLLMMIGE